VDGGVAAGLGGGEGAVGGEVQLSAAFVGEVVMFRAQWDEVVDVGRSVVQPVP
jgi:hypothetical protein